MSTEKGEVDLVDKADTLTAGNSDNRTIESTGTANMYRFSTQVWRNNNAKLRWVFHHNDRGSNLMPHPLIEIIDASLGTPVHSLYWYNIENTQLD